MQRKVLGRGLSALIQERPVTESAGRQPSSGSEYAQIVVDQIVANRLQPRTYFDEEKLKELSASIKASGVIQPVLVRRTASGYELIAGERRLRAAKMAGLSTIPAVVRDELTDTEALGLSLLENVQRDDLNPIEEATAYQRLIEQCQLTQEQVGEAVGKDRSSVANCLRLLRLPDPVRAFLTDGRLSLGHARPLLVLEDPQVQSMLADRIVSEGLSVRQVEQLVKESARGRGVARRASAPRTRGGSEPHVASLETELQQRLATRVHIRHGRKRGTIEIEYYSLEDLDRLVGILRRGA